MKTLKNRSYGDTVYSNGCKLKVINNLGDAMVCEYENGLKTTIPYNRLRLPIRDMLSNTYDIISAKRDRLETAIINDDKGWVLLAFYASVAIISIICCVTWFSALIGRII